MYRAIFGNHEISFTISCDRLRTAITCFAGCVRACVCVFFFCSLCKKESMRGNGTERRNGIRFRKGIGAMGL